MMTKWGVFGPALQHIEEALEIRQAVYGSRHPYTITLSDAMARVHTHMARDISDELDELPAASGMAGAQRRSLLVRARDVAFVSLFRR